MQNALDTATQMHGLYKYTNAAFNRMPWKRGEMLWRKQNYWALFCYLYVSKGKKTTKASCREYLDLASVNGSDYHVNFLIEKKLLLERTNKLDKRTKIVSLSKKVEEELDLFFGSIKLCFEIRDVPYAQSLKGQDVHRSGFEILSLLDD